MAKRFKLRLSIPSFQLCRSKNPFSFPKSPIPVAAATYLFSPINPKAFEIAYPNFPDPPPTTPTNHHNPFSKRHSSSKITPLKNPSNLRPTPHKTCNSPISFDSNDDNLPISPPPKQQRDQNTRVSSVDSACDLSSEETDSLFSSSRSLDASSMSSYSVNLGGIKKTSKNAKARKLKRYASNNSKLLGTSTGGESASSKSVFRRLMPPCAVEGKVKDSYAVVTRSEDPYEDFKRSMLEMILEKQMFEAKDLEELLQCFLSLNSRHHHAVIVAAFTEIWEVLFL